MGLPLFIAPVESDLLHRAADKSSTTAPSRSSIRRQSQPDTRERRAATRRHVSIRERLANGTLRMETTSSPREQPLPPWVATGFPPAEFGPSDLREASSIIGPDGLRQPRRDVLREMTHSGDRRRDELEAQIHELFASSDYRSNAPNRITTSRTADRNPNNSWWATNGHTRIARARLMGPWSSRHERGEGQEISGPPNVVPVNHSSTNEMSTITQTTADMSGSSQRQRPEVPSHEDVNSFVRRADRRRLLRTRDVDGLGDRDRSLSPEVWDTLLTTLTPDPQPPSAGSSFASTVASQSAGASSRTSFTAPDPPSATAADQACESAWEHSDTEEPDYEHPDFARIRRRRNRVRLNELPSIRVMHRGIGHTVGVDDRIVEELLNRAGGGAEPDGPILRRRRIPDGPLAATREPGDVGMDDLPEADGPLTSQLQRPRHGWVGQLSVGASDDEQNIERRRLNRESSTASGTNTHLGGEEWQRIVRSLARREDIPDEWWAEAGLSRILPQDGTE